jgi:hypothetical protein
VSFAHGTSFSYYFWEHFFATALVVFFGSYTKMATVALGLLMCVCADTSGCPRTDEQGHVYSNITAHRWLLDVRLACPISHNTTAWAIWANIIGGLLLTVCIGGPIGIAFVLWWQAHKGNLKGHITAAASDPDALTTRSHRSIEDHITARLAFRYADYDCNYEILKQSSSAHGRRQLGSESVLQRCRARVVLAWDSVLDLHRFLLAVAALSVTLHELHQLILVAFLLSSYLILILAVRPWKSVTVWCLQVLALVCLVFSCLGIMACNVADADSFYGESAGKLHQTLISVAVIVVNVLYAVAALIELARCVVREFHLRELWHAFRGRVRSFTDSEQRLMCRASPLTASRRSDALGRCDSGHAGR